MKLHEALRNIFRKFGLEVLEDGRFQGFLADYRAYDEFPAMRQVMRSLADGGYGKELGSRIRNGNDADVRLYGDYLKGSFSRLEFQNRVCLIRSGQHLLCHGVHRLSAGAP